LPFVEKVKVELTKRLVIVCAAVTFVAGSPAFAGLFEPPQWRGSEGSTYQEWHFLTSNPTPPPDFNDNPYGEPLLKVNTPYDWADGVWPLSGEIDMYIPNWPEQRPEKEIWIELIWQRGDMDPNPFLPDEPIVGVAPFESIQMSRKDVIDLNGWTHSLFIINMWPNPPGEWITVKGDILVDELIVDTRCIPEPATLVLFGMGAALMGLTRKGKFA
jgi:hypothetical protein